MRDRYNITDEQGVHFLTSTIVEWLPVFTYEVYFNIIINSLNYCMLEHALKLYGYVILDNHFHLTVSVPDGNLSKIMASMRKYTAHEIIKQLMMDNKTWLLNQFSFYKKRFKLNSRYQVWQEGMHPVLMQNREMLV